VILRARRAEPPAGAHDRHRLAVGDGLLGRPRQPVEHILQHAGNREVVFRRHDQQRVGASELLAKRHDRLREPLILDVAIVLRNVADACDLDGHAGGRELAGRPQQRGVVGLRPQAAGNPEHIDAIDHEFRLQRVPTNIELMFHVMAGLVPAIHAFVLL
jgi:hypothetical protein